MFSRADVRDTPVLCDRAEQVVNGEYHSLLGGVSQTVGQIGGVEAHALWTVDWGIVRVYELAVLLYIETGF